jgi:hypothetical protein
MRRASDINNQLPAFPPGYRHMLFGRPVRRIGYQKFHRLAAADQFAAAFPYQPDYVSADIAPEELLLIRHAESPLSSFFVV